MATSIYQCSPEIGTYLRQGEILSNVVRFPVDHTKLGESVPSVVKIDYPYVVVLSQACDLEQDFSGRQSDKPQLPDVLFCQLPTAGELRATPGIVSEMWNRIRKNKDERYHFLEKIPPESDRAGLGLPELGVDFKRYFTVPTAEVYRWLELGITKRRSVICTPYLEHLSSRFAYFLSRVGLPRDHISD